MLPWPDEALMAVSSKLLDDAGEGLECGAETKAALKSMMAGVHSRVTAACHVGARDWGVGGGTKSRSYVLIARTAQVRVGMLPM